MTNFRTMLLGSAAVGLSMVAISAAQAGEVTKSATFSGHVARMIGTQDNGDGAQVLAEDSDRSGSRIYIGGSAVSESLTMGAKMQFRPDGGGNSSVSTTSGGTVTQVQSYVYVTNPMGTLTIGNTTQAGGAFNMHSSSFSGAQGLGADSNGTPFGAAQFVPKGSKDKESGSGTSATKVSGSGEYTSDSGHGVQYASPDFNGFSVGGGFAGGATDGGLGEVVSAWVGYSADFDGTKVAAHWVGSSTAGDHATVDRVMNAGLGVELASGLNAAAGWGDKSMVAGSALNPNAWYGEIGYDMSLSDMGETSIMVNYSDQTETVADTGDYNMWALNVSQSMSDYGTTIFGGLAKQEYSTTATKYEDVVTSWVGIKVAF